MFLRQNGVSLHDYFPMSNFATLHPYLDPHLRLSPRQFPGEPPAHATPTCLGLVLLKGPEQKTILLSLVFIVINRRCLSVVFGA